MSNRAESVSVSGSLLSRKVEFHLARKPVSSFPATCSNFKLETLNPCSSSSLSRPVAPKSSNNNKPTDSFDFLDASLDLELSLRISFRRIGAGLENLGNTCFLNSVIQCLTYTEPLVAYLQSGKHQTTCRIAGFCALCAIQKHVNRALQSTGRILAPKDLVSNLRCISRNFRNSRQEDAHEYMIHLLESMHKCCLPSGLLAESPSAYEKSLVHKIFGGSLRSQVKCLQCSYCSNTFDPFLDLSLEIVKADSLNKALMHFTAAEQLDGGERQYKCERCKQKVRALKQLTVYKAPYVLTIHLKRFRSHFSGQKIDKKVQFGSTLDLKPFVSGAYEGDLKYTLYGVLVHAGWSTHSGHYYCFVRTSSGLWYSLDDCRVTQVSEKTVLEQKAYMLFYVRDRKNFTHKKAMDVIQKENLISTIRNASGSCSIPGAKVTQNGTLEKNSREAISSGVFVKDAERINTSGVAAQLNTSKMSSSNNTVMKQDMNQKPNRTVSSGTSNVKREDSLLSESDLDGGVLAKTKCTNASHARNAQSAEPTTNCGSNGVFNKSQSDIPVSAAKPCVNDSSSNVATDGSNKASNMVIPTADTKVHDAQRSSKNGCEPDKTGLLSELTSESRISKEGAVELTSDTHSILRKSKKLRNSNGSLPLKPGRCALHQTLKKKMFKPRVLGFHLSTKMLYGASLSLRKMRKGKRVKVSKEKVLEKHLLKEDCVPAETCALTSVALREEKHRDANKCAKNSPSISSGGVPNERLTCSKTVLATGKLPEESASTSLETIKANIGDSKQLNSQLQTGVIRAHTRELGEVTVARWEGIESPSEIVESKGQDSLSIGYVLDDWDEEYDRGKRKKVRGLRTNFDGSNPFQAIAAKKAKTNAKTGQYNQPFRI